MNNELKNNMDRVTYINDLYEKSGRSDPSHPYHCVFTNLHIEATSEQAPLEVSKEVAAQ